jgi:ferredoxin-thioredoxin reductase catalytic subunit
MIIKLNSNESVVTEVRAALKETGGYCPCAVVKNEDTKCPCKDFREMDKPGECHCGLYVKESL